MNNIVEVKNLYFKYDKDYIFENLSLNIEQNKFIAIVGENGTGKSTLLNLILSQFKYYEGKISLFGDDIKKDNHFKDIAYISQNSVMNYRNFPTTIEEVVKNHVKFVKKKIDIDEKLTQMGLLEHKKKTLSQLSGGQLQRVGVLLALIKEARFIILDEPTTGIDNKFSHELFSILKKFTTNKTVLVVTHELDVVKDYIDDVIMIANKNAQLISADEWKQGLEIRNGHF